MNLWHAWTRPHRELPAAYFLPNAVLAGIIGASYVFGSPQRTATSSFMFAKTIAPVPVWGLVFLAGAVAVSAAIAARSPRLIAASLWIGGAICCWWSVCFAISALRYPDASLVGWALYGYVASVMWMSAYLAWTGRPHA